jgi:uncharacterized membrane protein YphA (DoxX/SURF4 family)
MSTTLATYYANLMKEKFDAQPQPQPNSPSDKDVKRAIYIIIAALIIEILILVFAIRAIFMCQNAGKWNVYVSILLIVGLFLPYVGLPLAIIMIIYANVACKSAGSLRMRMRY